MVEGLVSTIIPVFNRPKMLQQAVASVLAQSYRPIEIIIVDDGSTDNTHQIAETLARQHDEIHVLHQKNSGPGVAREAGRQIARGEFIQYLDSDDLLLPEKFSLQVRGLQKNYECDVAYGMTRYRHRSGMVEPVPWKRSGERIAKMFPSFLESRWWDTPNPLYRTAICSKAGPWTDLSLEEDWEYDCRIAATGGVLCYVPEYVCEVRDHNSQRLCKGERRSQQRMQQRAMAHELIYHHALRAGISPDVPEMQHFARELFLLCRQCGAAGLPTEAKMLFALARQASGEQRGKGLDFRVFYLLKSIFGWKLVGRGSRLFDVLRNSFS